MDLATKATKHAGGLYRKTFRAVRRIESEAEHLHAVEHVGESAETPLIAILGVFLFLVPIFAVMLGLALVAYYLVG
jgi:hypothetical protein